MPKKISARSAELILRASILALCCVVAFATRLFGVVNFESVIHEFDPCARPP